MQDLVVLVADKNMQFVWAPTRRCLYLAGVKMLTIW